MADSRIQAKKVLSEFGFDEFMSGQIVERMKVRGVLNEAYDDNTMAKVYQALKDVGFDETQILDAVNSLLNAGILFRERG